MSTNVGIGFSQIEDPKEAARQASVMVKNELNSISTDFVVVFVSIHYAQKEILDVIHTILKPKRLIGSSSFGMILSSGIFSRGISILGINSTDIHFGVSGLEYNPQKNLRQTGYELNRLIVSDMKSSQPKRAVIFFYDSLIPYQGHFHLGAREVSGHSSKIVAAFSCDDFKLKDSHQFLQKQLLSKSIVGFMLGCDQHVIVVNKHGFKPLGKPRMITSAEGAIIHTIDHKPAVHIYEEFLNIGPGDIKANLLKSPALFYPLGIYLENLRQYLLRYPIDIFSDGSIVCQAEVPTNSEVHLMITNQDSCKNVATLAAQEAKDALGNRQAKLIIVFNSMTKHRILGRNSYMEIQAIQNVFGPSVPIFGMYTFGELCPMGLHEDEMESYVQNASLSLMAIS